MKLTFFCLDEKLVLVEVLEDLLTCCMWDSSVGSGEKIRMSSRHTNTNSLSISRRITFTRASKTAGVLLIQIASPNTHSDHKGC